MQRTSRYKRAWELGGIIALTAVIAAGGAVAIRGQMLNWAMSAALDEEDNLRVIELVHQGASVNTSGKRTRLTPLMCAANLVDEQLVRELIQRGARVNATTRGGVTPLMFASGWGEPQ